VGYGECYFAGHDSGLILLGHPIVEAYHWERNQQWIGGMLAPSAATTLKRVAKTFAGSDLFRTVKVNKDPLFIDYGIPLKKPLPADCPSAAINLNVVSTLRDYFEAPEEAGEAGMEADVILKRRNTREFLRRVREDNP
jgi:hypothetical protein